MGNIKRRNRGLPKVATTQSRPQLDMVFFERIVRQEVQRNMREILPESQIHHAIH